MVWPNVTDDKSAVSGAAAGKTAQSAAQPRAQLWLHLINNLNPHFGTVYHDVRLPFALRIRSATRILRRSVPTGTFKFLSFFHCHIPPQRHLWSLSNNFDAFSTRLLWKASSFSRVYYVRTIKNLTQQNLCLKRQQKTWFVILLLVVRDLCKSAMDYVLTFRSFNQSFGPWPRSRPTQSAFYSRTVTVTPYLESIRV